MLTTDVQDLLKGLTGAERLVLVCIALQSSGQGNGSAHHQDVRSLTGLTESEYERLINDLEEKELVWSPSNGGYLDDIQGSLTRITHSRDYGLEW